MPEWAPGRLAAKLALVEKHGRANLERGMLIIAAAVEAKTKAELSKTSHAPGTRSPAGRGQPPSLVTGTGRRSIGHQHFPGMEPLVRIGTIANVFPPSAGSRRSSTPSSQYLQYQEKDPKFGHPFLLPSFRSVITQDAPRIWLRSFRSWPRL